MEILNRMYRRALEGVGGIPSLRRDWRWVLLYSLCVYAAVLALRLSFAGRWDHPELWVNGERILATHDTYFWLAKAVGVGRLDGYFMAELLATAGRLFGTGPATVAFWAPAVLGALVSVVCLLWGWLLGGRNAGIFAALAGALTPGFFYRSRLGYYDTDLFTLLVPMLVAWMLAYWLAPLLRKGWFARGGDDAPAPRSMWLIFAFGLAARLIGVPHMDIVEFNILCLFLAFGLIPVGCRPGARMRAFYGLTIFWLAALPGALSNQLQLLPLGLWGVIIPRSIQFTAALALGAGLALAGRGAGRPASVWGDRRFFTVFAMVSGVLLVVMVLAQVVGSWDKLLVYFFPAKGLVADGGTGPIYPSIIQSIIEAKLVPLSEILRRGTHVAWLGYLCLAAGGVVVLLRPAAALLLPLVLLHLLSLRLGVRFTMFGGAALFVFLGVAVYWLTRWLLARLSRRELVAAVVQIALGCAMLFYCRTVYAELPITPVMSREHAQALVELGRTARGKGRVWTWWDWGYATQYYAGCATVADGGRHKGRDVFPVAFALSVTKPQAANRMIVFSAQYPLVGDDFGLEPNRVWDGVPRDAIGATLEAELSHKAYPPVEPQYLVVSWKDLLIVKWISYFGNWNLQTGSTDQASVGNYDPGELGINVQQGAVMARSGGGGLVKDITLLTAAGAQSHTYFMNAMSPQLLPVKQHLIINKTTGQSVLVDRIAYRSLLTRLLIGDPAAPEIAPYFKLVVDKLPFARIYEVVQNIE